MAATGNTFGRFTFTSRPGCSLRSPPIRPDLRLMNPQTNWGHVLNCRSSMNPCAPILNGGCHRCVPILFGMYSIKRRFRPLLPLQNPPLPDLHGKQILVLKGKHDVIIPSASTDRLVKTFQQAGADVTTREMDAGHEITARDLDDISQWLSGPQACRHQDSESSLMEETV